MGEAEIQGNVANGTVDSGNPIKLGFKAVNHTASGNVTLPSVDINDRVDWISNVDGVPFVMAGHPNIMTFRKNFAAGTTSTFIVGAGVGDRIIVTRISVLADNANTADTQVRIGFTDTTTPTTEGVILSHPGIPAGSGIIRGTGAGIIGVGNVGNDLKITSEDPGESIDVVVTYYVIGD